MFVCHDVEAQVNFSTIGFPHAQFACKQMKEFGQATYNVACPKGYHVFDNSIAEAMHSSFIRTGHMLHCPVPVAVFATLGSGDSGVSPE